MDNKVGIILQGGGAKGAYQVGALIAVSEIIKDIAKDRNPFKYISGVSVGSINATFLSTFDDNFNENILKLKEKWLNLDNSRVYDIGKYGVISSISNVFNERKSLFTLDPLVDFLNEEIDFKSIRDDKLLNIHAYSYDARKNIIFSNKDIEIHAKHLIASSSVPYVFNEIEIDGVRYGDGGLSLKKPSNILIANGCKKILGLSLDLNNDSTISNALFGSIFPDSLTDDFKEIKLKNQLVNRFNIFSNIKRIDTLLLKPEIENFKINDTSIQSLPSSLRLVSKFMGLNAEESNSVLNYIVFDREYSEYLINKGYDETIKKNIEVYNFFKS